MALEVVLGTVVNRIRKLEPPVQRAVRLRHGRAAVEASRLVEHHLGRSALADLPRGRARRERVLFARVALGGGRDAVVEVDLEDVGRARDHGDAAEATGVALVAVVEDDVMAEAAVAPAPTGDRVEEDRHGAVGDLSGGQALREELALEFQRKVTAANYCNKK